MKQITIFLIGLLFTFLYFIQVRHFVKEEGESMDRALIRAEAIMAGLIALGLWILFIVCSVYD